MCGATGAQSTISQEQIDAYKQAQEMTSEQYANQQAIYAPMAKQLQSIFSQGPNQKGFSDAERNNLNAQAVEGTAQNYAQAARATGEKLAAAGGGNNPLTSGGQAQLSGEIASSAAGQQSQEESQIQQADYSQGYDEWKGAGAGLDAIAAGENPLGYENAATGSGSAAADEANAIAAQQNQWISAVSGAVGAVGAGWASGGFKH